MLLMVLCEQVKNKEWIENKRKEKYLLNQGKEYSPQGSVTPSVDCLPSARYLSSVKFVRFDDKMYKEIYRKP
jgi:hypothetical protein